MESEESVQDTMSEAGSQEEVPSMDVDVVLDAGPGLDLVGSLFDREFDLSSVKGRTLGVDYQKEFREKQTAMEREIDERNQEMAVLCQNEAVKKHWRSTIEKTDLLRGLGGKLVRGKFSDAFCEYYQILARYPELIGVSREVTGEEKATFSSLHLCESLPGHFISAIDQFITHNHPDLNWEWKANSLNPHYEYSIPSEMAVDDELVVDYPDRWMFARNQSGHVSCVGHDLRLDCKLEVDLVTAVGGTANTQDPPDYQVSSLVETTMGEVNCALATLRNGGAFVMKVHSLFTMNSSRLCGFLMNLFKKVVIYKPPSSKSDNKEAYLVCTGFQKRKSKDFDREDSVTLRVTEYVNNDEDVPSPTTIRMHRLECEKVLAASQFFFSLQIAAMKHNIKQFSAPSLSTEIVNNLVNEAFEQVMRQCNMAILNEAENSSSLFLNREHRPWKELFKGEHVERLKQLEDPVRAQRLLRDKQAEWSLAFEMAEDSCTEVQWSEEELEKLKTGKPQLYTEVYRKFNSPTLQSLFIDPEIYTAFRSIHPEVILDIFNLANSLPIPYGLQQQIKEIGFVQAMDDFLLFDRPPGNDYSTLERDERGFIQAPIDFISTRREWVRFLLYVVYELDESKDPLKGVTLLVPRAAPPSIRLFLSRFSASVVAMFTVLFDRVNIPHPQKGSDVIMEFDLPNCPKDIPLFLDDYLSKLLIDLKPRTLGIFVPLQFLAKVHPLLVFYNNEMMKRIISEASISSC